ncbi:hypothetical protein B0H11DRAFT_2244173 [Mycena galericulata]|nr:hypothetical protein B0H11DRAFT_2244173 [Mycena galericulata]
MIDSESRCAQDKNDRDGRMQLARAPYTIRMIAHKSTFNNAFISIGRALFNTPDRKQHTCKCETVSHIFSRRAYVVFRSQDTIDAPLKTQGGAWFKPAEENVSAGVCLHVEPGHFRVFPCETPWRLRLVRRSRAQGRGLQFSVEESENVDGEGEATAGQREKGGSAVIQEEKEQRGGEGAEAEEKGTSGMKTKTKEASTSSTSTASTSTSAANEDDGT